MYKPLPIGVESFKELITQGYYYVDKTLFIKELIDKRGKVILFTRPRRFGKTLNLSMLRYFFEKQESQAENEINKSLFQDLAIAKCGSKYLSHMGNYCVIHLSLKSAKQPDFERGFLMLKRQIADEFRRHRYLLEKGNWQEDDRHRYIIMMNETADDSQYLDAIAFLSRILNELLDQKVIILIDEYDVPLENAYFSGFYEEMSSFIRSLFESALKTNPHLEFAVITGCLRITNDFRGSHLESIFTGLNNLNIISILNESYGKYFGFLQGEVKAMLQFYSRENCMDIVKQWYDGYFFGHSEVYNPWSMVNYMDRLVSNEISIPSPFWANTSSNSIVKSLVEHADISVKGELESLIEGHSIEKPVHEDITYADIFNSEDNLWNFLFFTGYLKQIGRRLESDIQYMELAIPNLEVRYIYKNTILSWFDEMLNGKDLSSLYNAIETGNTHTMEEIISEYLQETISFYDYAENYYHGFLAGLLKNMRKYRVISNRESGTGRPDIILKTPSVRGRAIVFELKAADRYTNLERFCDKALEQIKNNHYQASLEEEGYSMIDSYGISFYRKECMVKRI